MGSLGETSSFELTGHGLPPGGKLEKAHSSLFSSHYETMYTT